MADSSLIVFTDGAAKGNPGPGAGAIVVTRGITSPSSAGDRRTRPTTRWNWGCDRRAAACRGPAGAGGDLHRLHLRHPGDHAVGVGLAEARVEDRTRHRRVEPGSVGGAVEPHRAPVREAVSTGAGCAATSARRATSAATRSPWPLHRSSRRSSTTARSAATPSSILQLPDDTAVPKRRTGDSGAAKSPPYSYLSVVGGMPMRHLTWAECERRVKGQPGARFKKAASATDEASILRGWGIDPARVQVGRACPAPTSPSLLPHPGDHRAILFGGLVANARLGGERERAMSEERRDVELELEDQDARRAVDRRQLHGVDESRVEEAPFGLDEERDPSADARPESRPSAPPCTRSCGDSRPACGCRARSGHRCSALAMRGSSSRCARAAAATCRRPQGIGHPLLRLRETIAFAIPARRSSEHLPAAAADWLRPARSRRLAPAAPAPPRSRCAEWVDPYARRTPAAACRR